MVKGLLPERPHYGSELELFFVWIIFSLPNSKFTAYYVWKKKEWNINCAHWAEVFLLLLSTEFEDEIIQDLDQHVILIYPKLLCDISQELFQVLDEVQKTNAHRI